VGEITEKPIRVGLRRSFLVCAGRYPWRTLAMAASDCRAAFMRSIALSQNASRFSYARLSLKAALAPRKQCLGRKCREISIRVL
jgi:hypothetical protein